MIIAIVDTETKSLDVPNFTPLDLIEVAVVTYNTEAPGLVDCWSWLNPESYVDFGHITGMSPHLVATKRTHGANYLSSRDCGRPPWLYDAIIAHNVKFDREVLKKTLAPSDDLWAAFGDAPWVCSLEDIRWPFRALGASSSLVSVALDLGVGICRAHRAIDDCLTLAAMFDACARRGVSPTQLVSKGLAPQVACVAFVGPDERELPRLYGFRWDADRRQWARKLRQDEMATMPFPCLPVRQ